MVVTLLLNRMTGGLLIDWKLLRNALISFTIRSGREMDQQWENKDEDSRSRYNRKSVTSVSGIRGAEEVTCHD